MAQWRPDPTFYASPKLAMEAPPEKLAYVVLVNPTYEGTPDALAVVDVDPDSSSYGEMVPGSNPGAPISRKPVTMRAFAHPGPTHRCPSSRQSFVRHWKLARCDQLRIRFC